MTKVKAKAEDLLDLREQLMNQFTLVVSVPRRPLMAALVLAEAAVTEERAHRGGDGTALVEASVHRARTASLLVDGELECDDPIDAATAPSYPRLTDLIAEETEERRAPRCVPYAVRSSGVAPHMFEEHVARSPGVASHTFEEEPGDATSTHEQVTLPSEECSSCGTTVEVFPPDVGLLPQDANTGQCHTKTVCGLHRQVRTLRAALERVLEISANRFERLGPAPARSTLTLLDIEQVCRDALAAPKGE